MVVEYAATRRREAVVNKYRVHMSAAVTYEIEAISPEDAENKAIKRLDGHFFAPSEIVTADLIAKIE